MGTTGIQCIPPFLTADSTGTAVSPAEVHTGTRLNVALDNQWGADVAIAGHTRTAQDALAAANLAEQQRTKYHTDGRLLNAAPTVTTFF